MHTQVIWEQGSLRLSLSRTPDPQGIALLTDTLWGTPGGTQYRHLDTPVRIHQMPDPWFLHLHRQAQLLGILNISCRDFPGTPLRGGYIRYFSLHEALRRRITAQDETAATAVREGSLKAAARDFFANPVPLRAGHDRDLLLYAWVELENARSRDLCERMGFTAVRQFSTHVCSRLWPRRQAGVRLAQEADYPEIRARLQACWGDHGFFSPAHIFHHDACYVREENGRIAAGLSARVAHWQVVSMPGRGGRFLMRTAPSLPLLGRLWQPARFDFLAVEGMFCAPGQEHHLFALMRHALAVAGLHNALFWLDTADPFRQRLLRAGRMGPLYTFQRDVPVSVIVQGSQQAVRAVQDRPAYISAGDLC